MDPKKRARTVGRVEIVREAVPRRKIRLSDIMSESFSKYLMELDGDFIAPTGLRVSELDETPTDDQIKNRAFQIYKDKGGGEQNPKVNWDQATKELGDEEDLISARNDLSPTNPENAAALLGVQDHDTTVPQPPTTTTTATTPQPPTVTTPVTPPQPGSDDADSTGIVDNEVTGSVDGVRLPGPDDETERDNSGYVPPPPEGDVQLDDIASPGQQTDSADGGPDEFDEKNRPFTTQMDALIDDMTSGAAAGPPADVYSASERAHRRGRSLVEAVYGPRTLVIDRR